MDSLIKQVEVKLPITVNDVADLFCSMDGEEQALFFNCIGENVKKWNMGFIFQMQSVCDTEKLTEEGRKIMKEIGDYSDGISWMAQKRVDEFLKDIPDA